MYLAYRGYEAVGLDGSPTAIERAKAKAEARGLFVRFVVGNALELEQLGERFDTVVDCGLLHVFSDEDRARLIASIHGVLQPGGRYHFLCFSDRDPRRSPDRGPRQLSQEQIRASFTEGWVVESIVAAQYETVPASAVAESWLVSVRRL